MSNLTTSWSVLVTLELFPDTETVEWGSDMEAADDHARQCIAILTGSEEPYPLHATHEDYRTVYEASGHHDVFGEWSVHLIATDHL